MPKQKPSVLKAHNHYAPHDHKPTLFHTRHEVNPLHMGFELELGFRPGQVIYKPRLDTGERRHHYNRAEWELFTERVAASVGKKHLFFKTDGSLPDSGVEIVSEPMSLSYMHHINIFEKLETFREEVMGASCRAAGFHVHLTRKAFTPLHLYKFTLFHYMNLGFKNIIAGRFASEYCREPGRGTNFRKRALGESTGDANGRDMLNFGNETTIEARYFKGDIRASINYKNVEWLDAVFRFTKEASIADLNFHAFMSYLTAHSHHYPNLSNFILDRVLPVGKVTDNGFAVSQTNVEISIFNSSEPTEATTVFKLPIYRFFERMDRMDLYGSAHRPRQTKKPTTKAIV